MQLQQELKALAGLHLMPYQLLRHNIRGWCMCKPALRLSTSNLVCRYFDDYLPGKKRTVFHTKKGLSWRSAWGVNRYAANNAFLSFVHAVQLADQVPPHKQLLRPLETPLLDDPCPQSDLISSLVIFLILNKTSCFSNSHIAP